MIYDHNRPDREQFPMLGTQAYHAKAARRTRIAMWIWIGIIILFILTMACQFGISY